MPILKAAAALLAADLQVCRNASLQVMMGLDHSMFFTKEGEMTQHIVVALINLTLLTAWTSAPDAVMVPYNHPANPDARPAPPIKVPRIQAPNLEVTPQPARERAGPRPHPQPSPMGAGAPMNQH